MKYTVLFVTSLTSFLTPFMLSALNVAVPQIAKNLKFGATEITWVQLSFLLATCMFLLPMGKVSDIYGRKKLFSWGCSYFL
ncbi:MAG: MFS transporter [Elusimicrobia bacterium]|nr:MFS transporter [Elusimicrobiota bacterium]